MRSFLYSPSFPHRFRTCVELRCAAFSLCPLRGNEGMPFNEKSTGSLLGRVSGSTLIAKQSEAIMARNQTEAVLVRAYTNGRPSVAKGISIIRSIIHTAFRICLKSAYLPVSSLFLTDFTHTQNLYILPQKMQVLCIFDPQIYKFCVSIF